MRISQLGYLIFDMDESQMAGMERLLGGIMELELAGSRQTGFDARIDGRPFRLRLRKAGRYRLAAVGWEVVDVAELAGVRQRVTAAGFTCTDFDAVLCADRAVSAGFSFCDADGFAVEIVVDAPFALHADLAGKFLCGREGARAFGLGHLVQSSADPSAAIQFYSQVLGMEITDRIVWPAADLMFLNCNNRHHSLAIAGEVLGLAAGGIDHFMIEVRSRAQVEAAYARLEAEGFQVSMTLGEHTNDRMYSFYVYAPGAPFRIEYGFGGRDARECEYVVFDAPSSWGHEFRPPQPIGA